MSVCVFKDSALSLKAYLRPCLDYVVTLFCEGSFDILGRTHDLFNKKAQFARPLKRTLF